MSAKNNPNSPRDDIFEFNMPQANPSYLIAIAVGDLKFERLGKRIGVYLLEAAAAEFADTESVLKTTKAKLVPTTGNTTTC